MIIECQSCHARFRLDASKIRGKGARVRCRRCGDSIIVLLEGRKEEAPQPAVGGFLDLGSVVRDSLAETPAGPPPSPVAPPPDNLIPFPGPGRSPEPAVPRAAESPPAAEPSPFQRVEEKSDAEVLGPGRQPLEAPGSQPFEVRTSESPGGIAAADETVPPEPPPIEPHPSPPEADAPAFLEEGGFLLSDSETLDFLNEERRKEEQPETADARSADISFLLSSVPVGDASSSLRAPTPGEAPGPETAPVADISFRVEPAPPPAAPAEMTIEGNETPMASPPQVQVEVPPVREAPASPPLAEARGPSRGESPAGRKASSTARVAAGIAVLAVAGAGYFGFTAAGRKTVETVAPGVAALLGGKPAATRGPAYDVRNVIGYYDTAAGNTRILVIKGQVANLSAKDKSGIRVSAAILDNADKAMAEQVVYAGNVIPGDRLRKIGRDEAAKILGNRFGEGLANMNVGPGKSVPFMVVFFDAPENIDRYRLEAQDGD